MALRPLGEVGEDLARWASSDIPRIPTGYSFFDQRSSGGIATGEMMVFLARTSVGKTWFLVNVVVNNPTVPTVLFSLEMHARHILKRIASVYTGVDTEQIEDDLVRYGRSAAVDQTIKAYPHLYIEDEPALSVGDMSDVLDEYYERHGQRAVLTGIDFLELVSNFGLSAVEKVKALTQALKNLAREQDTALIVLHQVRRGETHKERGMVRGFQNQGHLPLTMSDGNYAGEVLADYLLGMYRPGMDPTMTYNESLAYVHDVRLQFLKTRTGGGVVPWGVQHYWEPGTGKIQEIRL
jgi:replicative DNA helicase